MAGNHNEVEKRLWDAADELRANSKLKSSEYSVPVLGLIFLRYADHKFTHAEKELAGTATGRRKVGKTDYQARGVMYLPQKARFANLLKLPEGENIGRAINDAMKAIEAENPDLKDVLPKTYNRLENASLIELLKLMASIRMDIEGDAFGKIYEYFLGNFAMSEGQKGGEFFTPTSIVKLIVEIIEPFHGYVYDPCCGSGGMFVQSARFVSNHKKDPNAEISVYGQERVAETVRLCKMNLAVHGLAGDIRQGNTYYEDLHNCVGKFDFVMANPPFNVDRVDKDRIKDDPRFPFGMPRGDNANYLWIQNFYSALNSTGRVGFVMHNSATDSELEIRRKLVDENAVDVILITSPNVFYTVNLPCTLWFLDRTRKNSERKDHILFIDAIEMYRQIDTVHREISPEQIEELTSIVRSFRGEQGYGKYKDCPGLCKRINISDVKANDYSLNPKVYVERSFSNTGHLHKTMRISKDISILMEEVESLETELKKELNMTFPDDRIFLIDLTKLLYRKWLINFDIPGLDVSHISDGEYPEGWTKQPFRNIVSEYIGGSWGKAVADCSYSEAVRIIRGTDMVYVNIGELSNCPVRYIKSSQLESRRLVEGDIIIEVSGGGKEQSTGRTTYITSALIGGFQEPLICASFCKMIRVNPKVLCPSLAYLYIKHLYDEKLIERYEVQSTGIKNFKFEIFLDKEKVLVPPVEIQERLQAVMQKIYTLIHLLGRVREQTSSLVGVISRDNGNLKGLANLQIKNAK